MFDRRGAALRLMASDGRERDRGSRNWTDLATKKFNGIIASVQHPGRSARSWAGAQTEIPYHRRPPAGAWTET